MLRLSEAMRLGAMIRPQAVHFFFDHDNSCALGGALEATGTAYGEYESAESTLLRRWRWVYAVHANCPVCQGHSSVREIIADLNNDHRWTRERIADWVQQQEDAAAVVVPEAEVAATL